MLAVDGLMLGEMRRIAPCTPQPREQIIQHTLSLADEACGPSHGPGNKS
jgi:hypothetical protein